MGECSASSVQCTDEEGGGGSLYPEYCILNTCFKSEPALTLATLKTPPSIFNDVLGPVMRGPSSSHSAASLRIGRMARDLMGGVLREVIVEYDPNGSLVTTHESQGSDLGLFGGLMGWETDDARLPDFREEIGKHGITVDIRYVSYGAEHPNTYKLTLRNEDEERTLKAISIGGGMIVATEDLAVIYRFELDLGLHELRHAGRRRAIEPRVLRRRPIFRKPS